MQRRRSLERGYAFDAAPRLGALCGTLPLAPRRGADHEWACSAPDVNGGDRSSGSGAFRVRVVVDTLPSGWRGDGAALFAGHGDARLVAALADGDAAVVDVEKLAPPDAAAADVSLFDLPLHFVRVRLTI